MVELSEKLRKLDISGTIRSSLFNCLDNYDLREEFADIEDPDGIDGLQVIIDKFTALGIKSLGKKDVDSALRIFQFLFKYSFSAVPTRVEQLHGSVDKANDDLQGKIERLQKLRMEQEVVDVDL